MQKMAGQSGIVPLHNFKLKRFSEASPLDNSCSGKQSRIAPLSLYPRWRIRRCICGSGLEAVLQSIC